MASGNALPVLKAKKRQAHGLPFSENQCALDSDDILSLWAFRAGSD